MTKKIRINNVEVSIEDFKKAMEENKDLLGEPDKRVEGRIYWIVDSWGEPCDIIKETKFHPCQCHGHECKLTCTWICIC